MLGRRAATFVVIVALTVAGWAATSGEASAVVPWADLPALPRPPLRFLPPPSGPWCRAEDLKPHVSSTSEGTAGTGNMIGVITVTNTGTAPCRIDGGVQLTGITASGGLEPIDLRLDDPPREAPTADLGPSREARFVVRIATRAMGAPGEEVWCDRTGTARHDSIRYVYVPPYRGMRVTLPTGEALAVDGSLDALQCHKAATQLAVGGFSVSDAWLPLVEPVGRLVPTLRAPKRAWWETTVEFTVTLTNWTREDIRLDPCPSYSVKLGYGPPASEYSLDCDAVRSIPSGKSVTYAMRLPVPDGADEGNSISWQLLTPHSPERSQALHVIQRRR